MLCLASLLLGSPPYGRAPLQPLDVAQHRTPRLVKQAKAAMRSTVADLRKARRLGSPGVDETLSKQVQVLRDLRRQFPPKDRGVRHHVPENATEIKASLDRMTTEQKDKMGKLAVGFAQASARKALQKLRATEKRRLPDWPNLSGSAGTVKSTKRKQGELLLALQRKEEEMRVVSADAAEASRRLVDAQGASVVALLAEHQTRGGANRAREAKQGAAKKKAVNKSADAKADTTPNARRPRGRKSRG